MSELHMTPEMQFELARHVSGKVKAFDAFNSIVGDYAILPYHVGNRYHVMIAFFRKTQTAKGPAVTFHSFGPIKSFLTEAKAKEYCFVLRSDFSLVPEKWRNAIDSITKQDIAVDILGGAN